MRFRVRSAAAIVVALVATAIGWTVSSPPASASPAVVPEVCATNGQQINGLLPQWNYTGMTTTVGVTGPSTIAAGTPFTLTYDISAALDLHRFIVWAGNYWHISQIGNGVYFRFTLPSNATFQSWTTSGSGNMSVSEVYVEGNNLVIHPNTAVGNQTSWTQQLDVPDVQVTYLAGASGTVSVQPAGSVAAPGNDPAAAPFLHMAITVNHFWTTPDPAGTPPPPVPFPPLDALNQITEYCQATSLPVLYSAAIQGAPMPAVAITAPVAGASLAQSPPAAAEHGSADCIAPPSGASCQGRIDGGSWFPLPDTTHALNAVAGPHTFSARMVDGAGQPVSGVAVATAAYTVSPASVPDQVPPDVTITSPANGATLTVGQQPPPQYQFACSDPAPGTLASCVAEYAGSANGPWTAVANGGPVPLNLVGGNPTHYVVRVRAVDTAGNTTTKLHAYTVLPGAVGQSGGFTCTGGIKVVAIGGGLPWNGSNCVPFASNQAPLQTGAGVPFTWSSALGAQTLANGVGAKVTYTFSVSGGTFGAPVLTGPGSGVSGATVSVAGNGTVVLSFTLTSATFTPPGISATVTPTAAVGGSVVVRFTRVAAGTQQLPPSWVPPPPVPALATTVVIAAPDVQPPTITFPSPAHGSVWAPGTPIPVSYSCSDGAAPAPTCTSLPAGVPSGSTLTPPAGTYTLGVQSVDAAGNVAYEEHGYVVGNQTSTASIAGCTVTEAAPCAFVVTVTPPSPTATTVDLSVQAGSALSADFTAPPPTVTVPANTASVSVPVATTDDALVESTETFTVALVGTAGGQVVIGPSGPSATGTIEDWNTSHQCHARWPAGEVGQIDLALANLPGGTGTVNDLVALGLTYWQDVLGGLAGPIDPGYFQALPPPDPSDVQYPVSFTQAAYAALIAPLMQLNGATCDEVVTLALYLGAATAGARPDDGGSTSRLCGLDRALCTGEVGRQLWASGRAERIGASMRTVLTLGRAPGKVRR